MFKLILKDPAIRTIIESDTLSNNFPDLIIFPTDGLGNWTCNYENVSNPDFVSYDLLSKLQGLFSQTELFNENFKWPE